MKNNMKLIMENWRKTQKLLNEGMPFTDDPEELGYHKDPLASGEEGFEAIWDRIGDMVTRFTTEDEPMPLDERELLDIQNAVEFLSSARGISRGLTNTVVHTYNDIMPRSRRGLPDEDIPEPLLALIEPLKRLGVDKF